MLLTLLLLAIAGEPTELDKERQALLDMGIDPAVLAELEKSAEQTVAIVQGIEQLNARLELLNTAVAKRVEVAACETAAIERSGAPIEGELAYTITLGAGGAVAAVTELRRAASVDETLSSCVGGVISGLELPPDTEAGEEAVTLTFPFKTAD